MPNKEFLETYPLYKKFAFDVPIYMEKIPEVTINMACPKCSSNQTFLLRNRYYENCEYSNFPSLGVTFRLLYLCGHCQDFNRIFLVKISNDRSGFTKVGQYPAWDIKGEPNIERLLGAHAAYYKRGLICESQGYGIGAFGYYRRITEEIIDGLLDEIADLLVGEDQDKYIEALEQTKKTTITQDKIDLVKDLLPPILRPEGMNPLSTLHSTLSEGLHAKSDEDCLESAEACREILVFLVNQISSSKAASKGFTDSMRKLLDKKGGKAKG